MDKPLIIQLERNILPLSADVHDICTPVLSKLGINHFNYRRSYKNGDTCVLTNDSKWVHHYYRQGYGNKRTLEAHKKTITSDYILWNNWEEDRFMATILLDAKMNFDIESGVTITVNHTAFVDLFSFGANKQNHLTAEALQTRIGLLYRFISYFYEKAQKLIIDARFHLSQTLTIPAVEQSRIAEENIEAFLSRDSTLQLIYEDGAKLIYFTKKESDCLYLMLKGYSRKMIAKRLNAMVRTVETHFNNIKCKFGSRCDVNKYRIAQKIKVIDKTKNEIIDSDLMPRLEIKNNNFTQYNDFILDTKTKKIFVNFSSLTESYLTTREAQVLYHLCHGIKISAIAFKLNISVKTVYEHIDNVKTKTNLFSQAEIIHKVCSTNTLSLIACAQ